MATIAKKMEGSERLERRVDDLLQVGKQPPDSVSPLDGDRDDYHP